MKTSVETIDVLLRSGMMGKDIADQLNVTPAYISKVKKELAINTAKHVQIERAGAILDNQIDAGQELFNLLEGAKDIVSKLQLKINGDKEGTLPKGFAEGGTRDPIELLQKYMQELRHQLGLYLDFQKSLYDIKTIAAFQQAVLEAINEVSPDVKARIVDKLKEARVIRSSLQL